MNTADGVGNEEERRRRRRIGIGRNIEELNPNRNPGQD